MSALLGIDIGGTNVKTAHVGVDGAVLAFASVGWSGGDPSEVVEAVALAAARLARDSGETPVACGCACAGLVDRAAGIVRSSPNLPTWRDVELARMLADRLGLPTWLENDANAAAFAEYEVGAARGAANAVMLTLGTGIGGGIVLDGRLYRGSHGMAGEVGHSTIDLDGEPCLCGARGCLERYANAGAIVARATELVASGRESSLGERATAGTLTAKDVGAAALDGDAVAVEVLASVGRILGVGLLNVSQILDPDVIVIGGGVVAAGEPLLGPAREELEAQLPGAGFRAPRVVAAELGETAGVVGATLLARAALDL
ncbi:MAG: ROK family protein [Candidatus Eisenbacteria bacterium]